MGKFAQISAALEKLPEARREEIATIIETLFHGDLHPEIADLSQTTSANPGPLASDADVDAFFNRLTA